MKALLRTTAILGSGSVVTVVVGLVSSKGWALLVGPQGVGSLGLVQSLLLLAVLLASLGVGTGLVRSGSAALARGDEAELDSLRRAAWLVLYAAGLAASLGLVVLREPVAAAMLGSARRGLEVALVALALWFSLAAGLHTSTLNAYRRVKALAKVGALGSLLGASLGLGLVWFLRADGVAPAVLGTAVVTWAVARAYALREVGPIPRSPEGTGSGHKVRGLLAFGLPFTASALVGQGVHLLLPVVVFYSLGQESVGFYRAALTVSVAYLGVLLSAMAQDYYPRVSAASDQPGVLNGLVNQQFRLLMLLGLPVILGFMALAPFLVPLIYSSSFTPAVEVLEWQLIGDLFKLSSWTMSFVILTRSGTWLFFGIELAGGLTLLLGTWLGMRFFGLAGVGIGFLASYVIYYLVVWLVVRHEIGLCWSPANVRLMVVGVAAALLVRLLPALGLESVRTAVALGMAGLAALASARVLWREVRPERPALGRI